MKSLEEKNAIVTGANRGMGREIVRKLASEGCNIWACARAKNEVFEQELEQLVKEFNVWIKPVYFDLENTDAIAAEVKGIIQEKKNIDILINNAGLAHMGMFELTSMNKVRKIYQINTFAPMQITQLVLRKMTKQGTGNIINIASVSAHEIYKGNAVYGASKAALCCFTQSLAAEVIGRGIRVNAIAPGFTDTDMSSVFEGDNPDLPLIRSAIGRKIRPEEIANAVIGLLSDNMNMVIGQVVYVNGGAK